MSAVAGQPEEEEARPRRVLLVEDEALFARAVAKRLGQAGFDCHIAADLAAGREMAARLTPDLVLLDLRLPDGDGMDLLPELVAGREGRGAQVIVLTAFGAVSDAVLAMKQGAADYLKKPIDLDELQLAVERVLNAAQLHHRLDFSRQRDSQATERVVLIGDSAAILQLRAQIERLGSLTGAPGVPPPTVLIQGETGAGKDVAARLLHQVSANRDAPFVQVDCAGLPRDLIETELFGHEKGAFTSAVRGRSGLIEAAEQGSVFLDEIGELPLDLQAKLLAVIERRRVRRIGSVQEHPITARFIAATNRSLPDMVAQGLFRADLYFRLNVITLTLPPLRERAGDVVLLAAHYAAQVARRYGLPEPRFEADAQAAMAGYSWPGNVRELRHLVERAVLLCQGKAIRAADLALPGVAVQTGENPTQAVASLRGLTLDAAERMLIELALQECRGNVSEAARRLGVTRMALRYRLEKHGLGGGARNGGSGAPEELA